ncbi:MAG: toll/interleukin-1 receptor domain-containing protein [Planctomycetaceae bacterium]
MRVFLSFSGDVSQQVAIALHDWIRRVIRGVTPWMSHRDIAAGNVWMETLSANLRATHMGILCLTPANKESPWLHFEAGAVWRNVEAAHVCPYLFGLGPEELTGSLREFQSHKADFEGTLKLMEAINAHPTLESPMHPTELREAIDVWWPRLESRLALISQGKSVPRVQRPVGEMVAETLELVRKLSLERLGPRLAEKDMLTLDVRPLVGSSGAVWQAEFASFKSVRELLDQIYFRLDGAVEPFTYDQLWLLRNAITGQVFYNMGTNWALKQKLLHDQRTLQDVGIAPGSMLEAVSVLDSRVQLASTSYVTP